MRPRREAALASPLARTLLVEMRTGPGPDGSWYAADLAHVAGANVAQVVAALGRLEREGLAVCVRHDRDVMPGACMPVYRATDAGRAAAMRIRGREAYERRRARRRWWAELAADLPDLAAGVVGLLALLAAAWCAFYLLAGPR